MKFEIRSDLPPPEERQEWPFKDMDSGTQIKIDDKKVWVKAVPAAHRIGNLKGWKFQTKWTGTYGIIWRIK